MHYTFSSFTLLSFSSPSSSPCFAFSSSFSFLFFPPPPPTTTATTTLSTTPIAIATSTNVCVTTNLFHFYFFFYFVLTPRTFSSIPRQHPSTIVILMSILRCSVFKVLVKFSIFFIFLFIPHVFTFHFTIFRISLRASSFGWISLCSHILIVSRLLFISPIFTFLTCQFLHAVTSAF